MKRSNSIWAVMFANAVIWIAVAIVASVAISVTGYATWGLLMIIPLFGGFSYKGTEESDKKGDKS